MKNTCPLGRLVVASPTVHFLGAPPCGHYASRLSAWYLSVFPLQNTKCPDKVSFTGQNWLTQGGDGGAI